MHVGGWYLTGTNISVVLFCSDGKEKKVWTSDHFVWMEMKKKVDGNEKVIQVE